MDPEGRGPIIIVLMGQVRKREKIWMRRKLGVEYRTDGMSI